MCNIAYQRNHNSMMKTQEKMTQLIHFIFSWPKLKMYCEIRRNGFSILATNVMLKIFRPCSVGKKYLCYAIGTLCFFSASLSSSLAPRRVTEIASGSSITFSGFRGMSTILYLHSIKKQKVESLSY